MNLPSLACLASACVLSLCPAARAVDQYVLTEESTTRAPGVASGKVEAFAFAESTVFADTTRDCWLYVPAQYDGTKPAALMVFQDGHAYVGEKGQMRVPIVFDNLIAKGDMPVTIGLFVNPGHRGKADAKRGGWGNRNNRSVEYDTPSADYVTMLTDELIPHVVERFSLKLHEGPDMRAICGMSSGGICAWTAAWEKPAAFGKVLSHIGSFTNIRGGHVYPALIRKTERKPIRVFLQDGANDLNNQHGSWPLGNLQMAKALAFAGYEHRFVFGDGAHNGLHGGAILPDSLRWLWHGWKTETRAKAPLLDVKWELDSEGYQFTDGAATFQDDVAFFSDLPSGRILRQRDSSTAWLDKGPRVSGLGFGPDALYAAVQGEGDSKTKKIVRIDTTSQEITTIATRVNPNDLVVADKGMIYFTDTKAGTVNAVPITARGMSRPSPIAGGIIKPNGIALDPNGNLLVSEYGGRHLWRFTFDDHGLLSGGQRVAQLRVPEGKADAGGDGMVVDPEGHVYVTSYAGIQVFKDDVLLGIYPKPQDKPTVSATVIGDQLLVCSADKIFLAPLYSKLQR